MKHFHFVKNFFLRIAKQNFCALFSCCSLQRGKKYPSRQILLKIDNIPNLMPYRKLFAEKCFEQIAVLGLGTQFNGWFFFRRSIQTLESLASLGTFIKKTPSPPSAPFLNLQLRTAHTRLFEDMLDLNQIDIFMFSQ